MKNHSQPREEDERGGSGWTSGGAGGRFVSRLDGVGGKSQYLAGLLGSRLPKGSLAAMPFGSGLATDGRG